MKKEEINIFEHQSIFVSQKLADGVVFDQNKFEDLVKFYGKGVPYFTILRNGIKFNNHVGVLQIGKTMYCVLPKADKKKNVSEHVWKKILQDMIRAVHGFEVKAPSNSTLKTKNNSILDLYFELFIAEVEYLLHRGLVKKYRKTEGNLNALKGSLLFSKHIKENVVHKERFYTKFTTYDTEHLLHIILYKTILVIKNINTNPSILSRINALGLNFPEMPLQKITEATFDKVVLNRKTLGYRKAIEIAKLILMNYHPDLSKGRKDVLALMFDMNRLWEHFVLVTLKKEKTFKVRGQDSSNFWKQTEKGKSSLRLRPDITISKGDHNYVLDTKWKNVDNKPSIEDVRQLYAYHHYFKAKKVALLYPGSKLYIKGNFIEIGSQKEPSDFECGLMLTEAQDSVKEWQMGIIVQVKNWIENKESNEE